MNTRQEEIREKGFDMNDTSHIQYGKIKSGTKTLEDAVLNLGSVQKTTKGQYTKRIILQALFDNDLPKIREISNYFYKTNGVYARLCNTIATMYRYDWYIVPEIYKDSVKKEEVVKEFNKILQFMDSSYISKNCAEMALGVVKNGAYYGYIVPTSSGIIIQELPVNFCRARYTINNLPAVEFNMKYFDIAFPDTAYRAKILKLFPDEFKKGYEAYRKNMLQNDNISVDDMLHSHVGRELLMRQKDGWWQLDPQNTVKFSFPNGGDGGTDLPLFANVIPTLFDLDAAQDLDRKKQMQKLLKIVVQKLPMDKNGELIFDVDEARDIHNNAVDMLRKAVGIDVLTTFADIDSIDTSDKNTTATQDDLAKVEREVFNAAGISQMIFNTNGNMALEKSILNDEGMVRSLLLQFRIFFDRIVQNLSSNRKKFSFRLYMLETTQYNYKDLAKIYKEDVNLGYPKIWAQLALGHSQSSILNTICFENEILNLSDLMIPPMMSSTLSMEDLKNRKASKSESNGEAGRPEKPDDQKSEKTIQNKEAMS